jgi:cytochrome b561
MRYVNHFKNSSLAFGWTTIILHWLLVLPIVGLFALGLYMVDLSYYDSLYTLAPQIHEALGIIVLLLMIFRVTWKWTNVTPAPPSSNSQFINTASHVAHSLMYLFIFGVLISGLLITVAGGQGINIFDWFVIPGPNEFFANQATLAGDVHYFVAIGLIAIVVLHTVAALKHHFIDKDNILNKMLGIKEKQ